MGYRGWPWHDGVLIRELRWLPQYQTFRVNSILSWYTAYQIRTKKATNIAPGNRISTVPFVIFVNRGRPELNYSADFQEPHTTRGHILRTTSCSDFRYLQPHHLSIPLNPKRYALSRFLEGIFGFAIWEFINKVLVSMAPLTKYKYFSFILWGVITSIGVKDVFDLWIGSVCAPVWMRQAVPNDNGSYCDGCARQHKEASLPRDSIFNNQYRRLFRIILCGMFMGRMNSIHFYCFFYNRIYDYIGKNTYCNISE